jgi:phosphoribosyl 1,2-cyclic phosphodiesterase
VALRLAVLGSGSGGNATLIEGGGARILVDAGFSCRGLVQRLRFVGVEPEEIDAILITHEHSDHLGGAAAFAAAFGVPIHCTGGTARAAGLPQAGGAGRPAEAGDGDPPPPMAPAVAAGRPFDVESLTVYPFGVPHDAVETVGFVVSERGAGARVAYATDLGHAPPSVRDWLTDCDLLVMEANHDVGMLRAGPYPEHVKERVLSRHGHLDNTAAADLLCEVARERTHTVVLAHLSRTNNRPDIALDAVRRRFADHGRRAPELLAADQARPMGWVEVG